MDMTLCISKRYVIFTIILCIASAGIGCLFAIMGQSLYAAETELFNYSTGIEYPDWVGTVLGVGFGLLVGVLYTCKLISLVENDLGRIPLKGTLYGIIAGVACSTLLHTVLIIIHKGNSAVPFIWGAIFGGIAGLFLGFISSMIFKSIYKR